MLARLRKFVRFAHSPDHVGCEGTEFFDGFLSGATLVDHEDVDCLHSWLDAVDHLSATAVHEDHAVLADPVCVRV